MPESDNKVLFDRASAKRIADVVRQAETSGFARLDRINVQPSSQRSAAVMVVGFLDDLKGMFPGKIVFYNSQFYCCTTTTSTTVDPTSTTTTTTTPEPTTTTTFTTIEPVPTTTEPTSTTNAPFLNFSNQVVQDCWIMIKETDVESVEIGDTFDSLIVGQLKEDELPVALVSYNFKLTCPANTTTPAPCEGRCKWEFNFETNDWELVDDTCNEGCVCDEPTYCGFQELACSVAITNCSRPEFKTKRPSCDCNTSTTFDPTSTTTTSGPTTLGPNCTGCTWRYIPQIGYRLIAFNCENSDTCRSGCDRPTGVGDVCVDVFTPCYQPGPPTPPPPTCTGQCDWVYDGTGWIKIRQSCQFGCTNGSLCNCDAPTHTPECGESASSPCKCDGPTNTTTTRPPTGTTTSTTTTLAPCTTTTVSPICSGSCWWSWDSEEETWNYQHANCNFQCNCDQPTGLGSYECEIRQTLCFGTTTLPPTTTTTTSSTTTTTGIPTTTTSTTPAPCTDNFCVRRVLSCEEIEGAGGVYAVTLQRFCRSAICSVYGVQVYGCDCDGTEVQVTSGGDCSSWPIGACIDASGYPRCGNPTTTTTPAPTTTTTPEPGCGGCTCYGVVVNCVPVAGGYMVTHASTQCRNGTVPCVGCYSCSTAPVFMTACNMGSDENYPASCNSTSTTPSGTSTETTIIEV